MDYILNMASELRTEILVGYDVFARYRDRV